MPSTFGRARGPWPAVRATKRVRVNRHKVSGRGGAGGRRRKGFHPPPRGATVWKAVGPASAIRLDPGVEVAYARPVAHWQYILRAENHFACVQVSEIKSHNPTRRVIGPRIEGFSHDGPDCRSWVATGRPSSRARDRCSEIAQSNAAELSISVCLAFCLSADGSRLDLNWKFIAANRGTFAQEYQGLFRRGHIRRDSPQSPQ